MSLRLDDEDWNRLVEASGLPSEARPRVETAIADFRAAEQRRRRREAVRPSDVCDELTKLQRRAAKLSRDLQRLLAPDGPFLALVPTGTSEPDCALPMKAIPTLDSLATWLGQSREGIGGRMPGRSAERAANVSGLTEMFADTIEELLRRQITFSQGDKRMMERLCRTADPGIGRGTIESAMKRLIKRRRKPGETSGVIWCF
jgi:hypothetical protein